MWAAQSSASIPQQVAANFNKATGAKIKIVTIPDPYEQSVQTKVATGDVPDLAMWQPTTSMLTSLGAKEHLQVLDDGRLTDGQGRTVDFRNTIVVLTSNLGSQFLSDASLDDHAKREAVMGAVRQAFRPEFLNRLDDVVMFDPLSMADLGRIVETNLAKLNSRLAERRITIAVTDAGKDWLAMAGFDPIYGARPLRRLMQTTIDDQLARKVLSGQVQESDTATFNINEAGDGLVIL